MSTGNAARRVRFIPILVLANPIGSATAEDVTVSFDHAKSGSPAIEISAEPGDRITATIDNTCPDRFDYQSVAFEAAARVSPPAARSPACPNVDEAKEKLASEGFCELKTRPVSFVHESKYRAYAILIKKKPALPSSAAQGLKKADFDATVAEMMRADECKVPATTAAKATKLDDANYLVQVETSSWALGMSGGVTISDVVDPRFAVVNDPNSTTVPPATIVVRDEEAEDSQKLGFGGFLHVHNEKWKLGDVPIAGTFGLGIEEKNSISAFVGVSAAAFDLAYLTLGWNWSSVDRLPAGQELGAPPINDNVLNNLPKKTDDGWFLAVSFKLMSPGEAFFKGKTIKTPEPTNAPKP